MGAGRIGNSFGIYIRVTIQAPTSQIRTESHSLVKPVHIRLFYQSFLPDINRRYKLWVSGKVSDASTTAPAETLDQLTRGVLSLGSIDSSIISERESARLLSRSLVQTPSTPRWTSECGQWALRRGRWRLNMEKPSSSLTKLSLIALNVCRTSDWLNIRYCMQVNILYTCAQPYYPECLDASSFFTCRIATWGDLLGVRIVAQGSEMMCHIGKLGAAELCWCFSWIILRAMSISQCTHCYLRVLSRSLRYLTANLNYHGL